MNTLILLVLLYLSVDIQAAPRLNNEIFLDHPGLPSGVLTTPELILEQGYPVQIHQVVTEDGYILELHRIPFGRSGPATSSRPPIYLQHCLLCSSSDWIMDEPKKALAYMLADAGYDVWLGNARGNTYSHGHTSLDTDSSEYWDFSFQEMGKYDAPAIIDYIINTTNHKQIYYIGFSMGTTIYFTMMNERPEFEDKIKLAVLLAPVADIQNIGGPYGRWMGSWIPFLPEFKFGTMAVMQYLNWFSGEEVLAANKYLNSVTSFCDTQSFFSLICHNILFYFTGYNEAQLNKDDLAQILAHTPAGTSRKNINHFMQIVDTGSLRKYDYESELENLDKYGITSPPEYSLSIGRTPVALYYSQNDYFSTVEDVNRIEERLPNVIHSEVVDDENFTHLDFIWARDADKLLYVKVIGLLKKFSLENPE